MHVFMEHEHRQKRLSGLPDVESWSPAMNSVRVDDIICTSSFACSATSPSFAYVSNPALDSSLCTELLLPNCSAAATRLRLLRLLLPDCVRSPIASASTAAPQFHLLVAPAVLEDSSPCPMFSNILRGVQSSVKLSTKVARH